jgi:hypothetical protein
MRQISWLSTSAHKRWPRAPYDGVMAVFMAECPVRPLVAETSPPESGARDDGRGQQYQGDLLIAGEAAGPQAGRTLR